MALNVTTSLTLALAVLVAAPVVADDCRYDEPREASIAVGAATMVEIDAGAGFLHVLGKPGLREVRASGTACAADRDWLSEIKLEARQSGGRVVVEARFPDHGWRSGTARLDFVVEMPAELAADVRDGSGDIRVEGVAGVTIDDGSGEIEVTNISGDVEIEDGSGEIEIRDVHGSVRLSDGSGDIYAQEVGADVIVDDDGSGDMTFRDVHGSVRVDDDGSGDIRVEGVTGSLVVRNDGSGDIRHRDIGGKVDIPRRH